MVNEDNSESMEQVYLQVDSEILLKQQEHERYMNDADFRSRWTGKQPVNMFN